MRELTVTAGVLGELSEAIQKLGDLASKDVCFRFNIDEASEPRLSIDSPKDDDRIFQNKGRIVLVISDVLATQYAGRTLDVNAAGDFLLA